MGPEGAVDIVYTGILAAMAVLSVLAQKNRPGFITPRPVKGE